VHEEVGRVARVMGLDLGTRRIGVAMSDELGLTARGVCVVDRGGARRDLDRLRALARQYEAGRVVVGLPLGLSGEAGQAARDATAFAGRIGAALGLPVEMWDERLSTVAAERAMLEADLSRARRRKAIDAVAAAYMLQGYLDRARGRPAQ